MGLSAGDIESEGSGFVAGGIGFLRKLAAGEDMPSCGALDDDRQVNDHRFASDIHDMPMVGVFDMSPQNLLQVDALLLALFLSRSRQGGNDEQQHVENLSDKFHCLGYLFLFSCRAKKTQSNTRRIR